MKKYCTVSSLRDNIGEFYEDRKCLENKINLIKEYIEKCKRDDKYIIYISGPMSGLSESEIENNFLELKDIASEKISRRFYNY